MEYCATAHGLRWVVPNGSRWNIVHAELDEVGHGGVQRTTERIQAHAWFPDMRRFIKKYVTACPQCLFCKKKSGKQEGFLHPIPKHARPFHTIHIDHLGAFPETVEGYKYILSTVDAFTKFLLIRPLKTFTAEETIKELDSIFQIFGPPFRLIDDKGTTSTSNKFGKFCVENGIIHHQIAVGMPRGNDQIERYNDVLKEAVATTTKKENEWNRILGQVQIGLNNMKIDSTGVTPSQALLGFNTRRTTFSMDEN